MSKKDIKTWEEMILAGIKIWQLPENERPKGIRVTLVIPDLHIPFHNKKALDFLVKTALSRGITDIVCIGDFFDHYWESKKYIKNYNIMGPIETKKASQKSLELFGKEFPYMDFIIGNHDLRIVITNDDDYFENFEEALKRKYMIPTGWKFNTQLIKDDVCYIHGTGTSGQNAALTMMKTKRMSTVIGHTHSFAGVQYSSNGNNTAFALNAGSLIDLNAPVFDYGLTNREKPILGCAVVYNSSYAEFIPLV